MHSQAASLAESSDPSATGDEVRRQETSLASSLREVASFWSTQFGAAAAATPRKLRLPVKRIGAAAPAAAKTASIKLGFPDEVDARLLKHQLQVPWSACVHRAHLCVCTVLEHDGTT
jgi:hypothetical protein